MSAKNLQFILLVLTLIVCGISSLAQINVTDVYDTNPKEGIKKEISNLDEKQNEFKECIKNHCTICR